MQLQGLSTPVLAFESVTGNSSWNSFLVLTYLHWGLEYITQNGNYMGVSRYKVPFGAGCPRRFLESGSPCGPCLKSCKVQGTSVHREGTTRALSTHIQIHICREGRERERERQTERATERGDRPRERTLVNILQLILSEARGTAFRSPNPKTRLTQACYFQEKQAPD